MLNVLSTQCSKSHFNDFIELLFIPMEIAHISSEWPNIVCVQHKEKINSKQAHWAQPRLCSTFLNIFGFSCAESSVNADVLEELDLLFPSMPTSCR